MRQKRQSVDYNLHEEQLARARQAQAQILAKARAARAFQSGGTEALISCAKANSPINRAVARVMGAPR